jgi:predicted thioesterase
MIEPRELWECIYTYKVRDEHTAEHLRTLGEKILSTPCLILYMESAARKCLDERTGKVSVGYRIDVKHRKSVMVGEDVNVYVRIFYWDGRRALIYMRATDSAGELVGEGFNERFVR